MDLISTDKAFSEGFFQELSRGAISTTTCILKVNVKSAFFV